MVSPAPAVVLLAVNVPPLGADMVILNSPGCSVPPPNAGISTFSAALSTPPAFLTIMYISLAPAVRLLSVITFSPATAFLPFLVVSTVGVVAPLFTTA